MKLEVPCVTREDGGRLLFECDDESFNTKMCDGEVIRVVKPKRGERYPTFHIRFEEVDQTSDMQPLAYVQEYGITFPLSFQEFIAHKPKTYTKLFNFRALPFC